MVKSGNTVKTCPHCGAKDTDTEKVIRKLGFIIKFNGDKGERFQRHQCKGCGRTFQGEAIPDNAITTEPAGVN
jgi:transposase-like protein